MSEPPQASAAGCFVDISWLPVAAGTASRLRQWSLACWEALDARVHRRRAGKLYHSALKLGLEDGRRFTLEMTPAFIGEPVPPAMTGPVGCRGADRLRLFCYQLRCLPGTELPDEAWTVATRRLSTGCAAVSHILALMHDLPPHVWGWRARGTSEMWTSDSAISWLLVRAGLDVEAAAPPGDGRAPGWLSGIQAARRP